jgi:CrcB protein
MNYLLVFIGGGLGSLLRFWISSWMGSHAFPWATWIANAAAAVVLGTVVGFGLKESQPSCWLLIAVGFCGGLSTFSTFSLETLNMMRQGNWWLLSLNVCSSLIVSLAALYFFIRITQK